MSAVSERSEIDEAYKWDLESVFASDDEWEAAYEEVGELIDELGTYRGRATEDGETLLELLELYEETMRRVEKVRAYARLRKDEDTRDQHYQALSARAQSLASEAHSAASFLGPELQELDRSELEDMMAETDGLAVYEHYFDDVLRMKEHTRSAEVENLLAEFGEVLSGPQEVYQMLSNADVEFPTVEGPDGEAVEITNSNFTTLLKRSDRDFRRRVYEGYFETWADLRNTVATAYEKSVTGDVKVAGVRGYDTVREAALDRPNVPVEVYDNLLETVHDNLGALHRHAELKREALDVDELRMWDLYTPLASDEEPTVEYEEAKEHVVEAVGALGEDYQSRVAEGLESRWVDVYENEGKRSGAYSSGTYDTQPYILMNYQDDVSSMFTLAHELGHSLHSQLTSENQPYVYSDYEIFTAEVASTVNESLLTRHLLENVDDERFHRHVLDQYLERVRSTLFRQTMFADFELQAHRAKEEGDALTPDRLDEIYGDLKADFYEPAVLDDHIAREWMRIPHFFRAYYVFQYSTGLSAAVALARQILDEGEPAAARYREFLERGSRAYPLELLRDAGVDMSSPGPIETAIDEYDDQLDEMASLL
ncbi:oligoendopeptidase F [Halobacteriales archaeon QS_1_68_20]|nr:MAG: oligoendopeptidase F [Halobacteriales archaeon QS_1_68_20]